MLVLETFATRLRVARQAKRLSQDALATLVGTYKKEILRLERGTDSVRISIVVLQRLAPVLDVSLDWLIGKEGHDDDSSPGAGLRECGLGDSG